jgi:Acyl-CoA reductase (LuxC)
MKEPLELPLRIDVFIKLGQHLLALTEAEKEHLYSGAVNQNNWFTKNNIDSALEAIGMMLNDVDLENWVVPYDFPKDSNKNIGLVMAGNIPMVGFHDLLCVLITGNTALVKLSSQDELLMKYIIKQLIIINPAISDYIKITERLNDTDAVIATGSDNTARYFKHYFGKNPHIIRQNRTSIAVLNGQESDEDIRNLGEDIFQYYGLGCRNVSKIYVPENFDNVPFIDALMPFEATIEHHKFRNNYDYNKSIYLVNREPHFDSGFFLMRESIELVSPISVIFYEKYSNEAELNLKISANQDKIQAIVSNLAWYEGSIPFGTAQCPTLEDYADGVDTMEFLTGL